MIYIGIDTGVHTGIAIWDNRKRSLEMVKQMPIHRAMAVVQSYADMQKTGVGDKNHSKSGGSTTTHLVWYRENDT